MGNTPSPGNPRSPASRRLRRREGAEVRAEARAARTAADQLSLLAGRRGESAREQARLEGIEATAQEGLMK
jgi:hypothetical protein